MFILLILLQTNFSFHTRIAMDCTDCFSVLVFHHRLFPEAQKLFLIVCVIHKADLLPDFVQYFCHPHRF